MIRLAQITRKAVLALAVLALVGCTGDMQDLEQYIADVKARPASPIPPIPPVQTYTPYTYVGTTGRDPFISSTSEGAEQAAGGTTTTGPRPDLDRPREYLERFELDTLTMVGTFAKEGAFWGLVRDPDGVVHRVSVNDYMGKNHGKIVNVGNLGIQLSEFITDGAGGWLVRDATLALEGT
jgi:type IV pilus assembly protein PilP